MKTLITDTKTSAEWQAVKPDVKVLDADGWDRLNYDYSWNNIGRNFLRLTWIDNLEYDDRLK